MKKATMKVNCPTLFYEEVMKAVQENAEKYLPEDRAVKFSIEAAFARGWIVSLKKRGKR